MFEKMFVRKIIAATISGAVFAILLGFVSPNPFGEQVHPYFYSALTFINVYLIYSFPVILFYGVLTSIVSDKIAEFIAKKSSHKIKEIVVSGILHIVFGLVLLPFSLAAALLFFVTDRILLKQKKNFHWLLAVKSFAIPAVLWIISIGIVWINDFISNFRGSF